MYALIWKYENNVLGIFVVIISENLATAEIIAITCTETNITFMDTQKKTHNHKGGRVLSQNSNICMQNMYLLTVHDLP